MTPFGSCLQYLRQHSHLRPDGLRQKELAALIGLEPTYYCALENGRRNPPGEKIMGRIAEVLELSADEHNALILAAKKSVRKREIPRSAREEEFELVDELFGKLGKLTPEQIEMMRLTLRMNATSRFLRTDQPIRGAINMT